MEEDGLEGNFSSPVENDDPENRGLLRNLGVLFSPMVRPRPSNPRIMSADDGPVDEFEFEFQGQRSLDSPGLEPPLSDTRRLLGKEDLQLNYEYFIKNDPLQTETPTQIEKKEAKFIHKHSFNQEKKSKVDNKFDFLNFTHGHILTSPCSRFTLKSSQLPGGHIASRNMNLFHNDGFDNDGYRKVREFQGFDLLTFIPETAVVTGIKILQPSDIGSSNPPPPSTIINTEREVHTMFFDIKSELGYKSKKTTTLDIGFLLRDVHDSAFRCYVSNQKNSHVNLGLKSKDDRKVVHNGPPTLSSVFGVASGSSECSNNDLKKWKGIMIEFGPQEEEKTGSMSMPPEIKVYPLTFNTPKLEAFQSNAKLSFTLYALGTKLAVIGEDNSKNKRYILAVYTVTLQKTEDANAYTISLGGNVDHSCTDFHNLYSSNKVVGFKSLYDPLRTSSHSISHLPLTDKHRKLTLHLDIDQQHHCKVIFKSQRDICCSSIKERLVSRRDWLKFKEEKDRIERDEHEEHQELSEETHHPQDDWPDCFLEVVNEKANKAIKISLKNSPNVQDKEHYVDVFNFVHPNPDIIRLVHVTPDLRHLWIIEDGSKEKTALMPKKLNLVNKPLFNLFTPVKALKRNSQILSNGTFEVRIDNREIQVRNFKPASGETAVIKKKHEVLFEGENLKKQFKCFSATPDFSKVFVMFMTDERFSADENDKKKAEIFLIEDITTWSQKQTQSGGYKKYFLDLPDMNFSIEMKEEFLFILRPHKEKLEYYITEKKEEKEAPSESFTNKEDKEREKVSMDKRSVWFLEVMKIPALEQSSNVNDDHFKFKLKSEIKARDKNLRNTETDVESHFLTFDTVDSTDPILKDGLSLEFDITEEKTSLSKFLVKHVTILMNKLIIGPFQPQKKAEELPEKISLAIVTLKLPISTREAKKMKLKWLESYAEERQFKLSSFARPSPYAMKEEVDHTKFLLYSPKGFKVINLADNESTYHYGMKKLKIANTDCKRILKLNSVPRLSASGKQVVYADSENQVRLADFDNDRSLDEMKSEYENVEEKIAELKNLKKENETKGRSNEPNIKQDEITKAKDKIKNKYFNGKNDRILTQIPRKEQVIDLYLIGSGDMIHRNKNENPVIRFFKSVSTNLSKISRQLTKMLSLVVKDKRKLVILSFQTSMIHVRVFCFEKRSIIYNFVAESPYDLDKYFTIHRDLLCCYDISKDMNQNKKTESANGSLVENAIEVSIYDSDDHSKFSIFYEFGLHSKYYSGHFLALLTDEFTHEEGNKGRQDTLRKGVKAWLNLISPSKHCEIAPLAENCLKLRCPLVMQEFLNNTQEDMAYTHCDLFDLYDFKKRKGETGDAFSVKSIWDTIRYCGKKDKYKPALQNDQFKKDLYEMFKRKSESSIESSVLNERKAVQNFLQRNIRNEMQDEIYQELFKLQLMTKTNEFIKCNLPNPLLRTFGSDFSRGVGYAIDQLRGQLEEEAAENYTTYEVYRSLVQVDLSVSSDAVVNMLYTMEKMVDKDLEGPLMPIIYFIWDKIFYLGVIVTALYWIMTAAAYCLFVYYPTWTSIQIFFFCFNGYFVILEAWSINTQGIKHYIESPWNWIDMVLLLFSNGTAIALAVGLDPNTIGMVWCRVIALVLVYTRALTFLRIWRSTRYLITMVMEVFIDMIPFLVILTGTVILISFIWHLSPLLTHSGVQQNPDLYTSTYEIIMILFGQSPQNENDDAKSNFQMLRLCIIGIANLVLSLCLLNFLIAVISGTYTRITGKKNLYDVRALITLLIEVISYFKVPSPVGSSRYYILTLHPVQDVDESIKIIQSESKVLKDSIESYGKHILTKVNNICAKDGHKDEPDVPDEGNRANKNYSMDKDIRSLENHIKILSEKNSDELKKVNEKVAQTFDAIKKFESMLKPVIQYIAEERKKEAERMEEKEKKIASFLQTKLPATFEMSENQPKVFDPREVAVFYPKE